MAKKVYVGIDGVARKVKKIYIGVDNSLPAEYTQVTYIQSSGSQYINTGFKPNQNTRVVMDAQLTTVAASQFYFGTRTSSGTVNFNFLADTTTALRSDYGESKVTTTAIPLNTRVTIDKDKNVCKINSTTVTNTASTFQCSFDLFLFAADESGSAKYFSSARLYSCKIYDNGTLIRDFVPCVNEAGAAGLYDKVKGKFYANVGSGSFSVGSAVQTAPGQPVARKVKKGYIGVGGVARPFWTGGELEYYGTITNLSSNLREHAATSVGDYALFGGGATDVSGNTETNLVNAYSKSLVRSTPTALSVSRKDLSAAHIGNYALFAGGVIDNTTDYNTIDAYNTSLSRTNTASLSTKRYNPASVSTPKYAIFAAGGTRNQSAEGAWYRSTVDAYNSSLSRTSTALDYASASPSVGLSVGEYAIFFGHGSYGVDVFDASLTRTNLADLNPGRFPRGASIETHAIIAGGHSSSVSYAIAEAYDSSLVKMAISSLSVARTDIAAIGLEGFAIFAGGSLSDGSGTYYDTVESYDESLTRKLNTPLNVARDMSAAAVVGSYALFGGGRGKASSNTAVYSTVDVFTV